jgi:hypothetical protein
VFDGKIKAGIPLATVKAQLAQLFRVEESKLDILFRGGLVVVKGGTDRETAEKYLAAFDRAGAVCRIEPEDPPDGARHDPGEAAPTRVTTPADLRPTGAQAPRIGEGPVAGSQGPSAVGTQPDMRPQEPSPPGETAQSSAQGPAAAPSVPSAPRHSATRTPNDAAAAGAPPAPGVDEGSNPPGKPAGADLALRKQCPMCALDGLTPMKIGISAKSQGVKWMSRLICVVKMA